MRKVHRFSISSVGNQYAFHQDHRRGLSLASAFGTSTALNAAPTHVPIKKSAEPAVCSSLATDYENASKKLALLKAESAADDSAVRATMRETQSTNVIDQARMTMDLMRNNGCAGPTAAPSADKYLVAALNCVAAQTKQSTDAAWARYDGTAAPDPTPPSECDREKWTTNSAAPVTQPAPAQPLAIARVPATPGERKIWLQLAHAARPDTFVVRFHALEMSDPRLFQGISGYIAEATDGSRLLVGPFYSAADAERFAGELHKIGIDAPEWSSPDSQIVTRLPD